MSQPLTNLRVFIEVARSGSFTRAADTLCVSQSAISKRIQSLEEQLGLELFIRTGKRLHLSPAGDVYLAHVNDAMALLESGQGLAREVAGQHLSPHSLEISASPAFATHWLIPRLPGFIQLNPVSKLSVRPRLPDLASANERFDIEIRLGAGRWPNARSHYLLGREMALIASPELIGGRRIRSVRDLHGLPLLRRAQRGYDWHEWAQAKAPDWEAYLQADTVFEGFSVLIPAIRAGLGLGICPLFMVMDELRSGSLVRPLQEQVLSQSAYYVVLPKSTANPHAQHRFLEWLQEQANATQMVLNSYLSRTQEQS